MISILEVQDIVCRLAKKINAPVLDILTFEISRDDGTPCVQVNQKMFYYSARDRNVTTYQNQTEDVNELLYWIFRYITNVMAETYAVKHPINRNFSRRVKFSKQIHLLKQIDEDWAKKRENEIQELLVLHPYNENENFE